MLDCRREVAILYTGVCGVGYGRRRSSRKRNRDRRKRRRLREGAAPGRGVTRDDRRAVYLRYGDKCLRCGSKDRVMLDHVISLYSGGRHDPDNLQPLCRRCNFDKGWAGTDDYRPKSFNGSVHKALAEMVAERRARRKSRRIRKEGSSSPSD